VWAGNEPQPVPPHNKDGSKPSVDQYDTEKELLDLLQRKFADDNSSVPDHSYLIHQLSCLT